MSAIRGKTGQGRGGYEWGRKPLLKKWESICQSCQEGAWTVLAPIHMNIPTIVTHFSHCTSTWALIPGAQLPAPGEVRWEGLVRMVQALPLVPFLPAFSNSELSLPRLWTGRGFILPQTWSRKFLIVPPLKSLFLRKSCESKTLAFWGRRLWGLVSCAAFPLLNELELVFLFPRCFQLCVGRKCRQNVLSLILQRFSFGFLLLKLLFRGLVLKL